VTNSYPELKGISSNIKSDASVLDGEVVILENGLPSFESLQNRFGVNDPIQAKRQASKMPVTYIAFDLLHLDGQDLIDQPLLIRRRKLARLIKDGPHILLSQYISEKGKSYFRNAVHLGFEGIMAKKTDSTYQIGARSRDWLKIKHVKTLDCIVAGFTRGEGDRSAAFGALVLAAYDRKKNLVHLGNVGTGFTDTDLNRMTKILRSLVMKTKTIHGDVKAPSPITWVKPKLVAEVGYMAMTKDTKLRFPRFVRLRLDGNVEDCVL
jgi:DNA ligase D-like protein (predicted ligase)